MDSGKQEEKSTGGSVEQGDRKWESNKEESKNEELDKI